MSKENKDDDNNKGEDEEEINSRSNQKHIKFQPKTHTSGSVESFNSAKSSSSFEGNNDSMSKMDYQVALNKWKKLDECRLCELSPLEWTFGGLPLFDPEAYKPEIETAVEDTKKIATSAKSSRQLFEIAQKSSVFSDPDMKLVSSTYLRKLEGVKEAINHGANVNTFRDKQTPLLISTEIGEHRLVAYLLTVPNINPNIPNVFGETPLLIAVRNAFGKIIKLLLNHNADVNKADHMGRTPLQIALLQKRPPLVKLLLAYGADYEKEDCFGERPMYTSAVKRPHLKCLLVLLRVGANPEYFNISGMTLLSRAILNSSTFKIIQTLIRFGASVNSQDLYSSKTPLHFAAMTNDVEITNYLISHGADPNKTTIYNFTPFDEAVFHKNIDVAEILLKHTKKPKLKAFYALKPEVKKEMDK